MTLYIFCMTENAWNEGIDWDTALCKNQIEVVDAITGDSNDDCEAKAGELYGDADKYGWTYSEIA